MSYRQYRTHRQGLHSSRWWGEMEHNRARQVQVYNLCSHKNRWDLTQWDTWLSATILYKQMNLTFPSGGTWSTILESPNFLVWSYRLNSGRHRGKVRLSRAKAKKMLYCFSKHQGYLTIVQPCPLSTTQSPTMDKKDLFWARDLCQVLQAGLWSSQDSDGGRTLGREGITVRQFLMMH